MQPPPLPALHEIAQHLARHLGSFPRDRGGPFTIEKEDMAIGQVVAIMRALLIRNLWMNEWMIIWKSFKLVGMKVNMIEEKLQNHPFMRDFKISVTDSLYLKAIKSEFYK